MKSIISQQVERLNTKDILQRVKFDATSPSLVGLISVGISPDATPGRDHVTVMDTE